MRQDRCVWHGSGLCYAARLVQTPQLPRGGAAPETGTPSPPDRIERETIAILKRLSRRAIEPERDSELLADLGFDSLLVLELVGELEDHFDIALPLNSLTHIRTVAQVVAEVRRLAAEDHQA
jgi:acyl carrier protein